MERLIAIATLSLTLSFSSLGSGVAIQREGSQGTSFKGLKEFFFSKGKINV
jgi:hypothetical protein